MQTTWRTSALATMALLIATAARPQQPGPAQRTDSAQKPAPNPAQEKVFLYKGQPVAASEVTFTIERTVCFGTCPTYTVVLHGDGRVDWKGDLFVAQKGERHSRIESEAVQMLLDRVSEMDFFRHPVSFDVSGMDGSNCELTLRIAGLEAKADVPHWFLTVNADGTENADWKAMRDEIDLTRCIDALTESWRWIHVEEEARTPRTSGEAPLTEIPEGFSIGIRRLAHEYSAQYEITIDSAGAGKWKGIANARDIGDRGFTVPEDHLLLLANRARSIVGLGRDITLGGDQEGDVQMFVHATGRDLGPRVELPWPPYVDSNVQPAGVAKADALADLIDVFARTSHFVGSWNDRYPDAMPRKKSSK